MQSKLPFTHKILFKFIYIQQTFVTLLAQNCKPKIRELPALPSENAAKFEFDRKNTAGLTHS